MRRTAGTVTGLVALAALLAPAAGRAAASPATAGDKPRHVRPATANAAATKPAPAAYVVVPPADWVAVMPDTGLAAPPGDATGRSEEFLLVDRQGRLAVPSEHYYRFVVRPLNPTGVSGQSRIEVRFDPERERLRVHAVTIRRGAERLDGLRTGRVEVLRREASLEDGLIDGVLTFHLLLRDVRVGDVIDYSYTLESRDPEWGDRAFGEWTTGWDDPVGHERIRILNAPGTTPALRASLGEQPVVTRTGDGWEAREWDWRPAAAVDADHEVPAGIEVHPRLQYSQFTGWGDIVTAAVPLFAAELPASADVQDLLERFRSQSPDAPGRVVAVLRFVQEEVRYTGIEIGERAYRPTDPGEVLRRRYGDCKDKTLLAVSLLRKLGIEADPALVSTLWRRHTHERLPSPGLFDHAIVRVRLDGASHWYDATRVAQGGDFMHFGEAHFGEALVVRAGTQAPEAMDQPAPALPLVSAREEYDLRAGTGREATMDVTTTYRGEHADNLRRQLRGVKPEDLLKQYVDYYRKRYSEIESRAPLEFQDDLVANELLVREHYRLPNPFGQKGTGKREFAVAAGSIGEHLRAPEHTVRKLPLALDWPVRVEETLLVRLPGDFHPGDESHHVDAPEFSFESRGSHTGNDITLEYRYRTLKEEVPVAELPRFVRQREEARSALDYSFEQTQEEAVDEQERATAEETLKGAVAKMDAGEAAEAEAARQLQALVASHGFDALDAQHQHTALLAAAAAAYDGKDFRGAREFARRATSRAEAGQVDWMLRLRSAWQLEDKAEAMVAMTMLASRWPAALAQFKSRMIFRTVHDAPRAGAGRYRLLKALADAHFDPEDGDASFTWCTLALLQLERGELDDAIATLRGVSNPFAQAFVLADHRFAPARAALGAQLDVTAAAERAIVRARQRASASPGLLQPVDGVVSALLRLGRYEEALQLVDATLAEAARKGGAKAWKDGAEQLPWLNDLRSSTLLGLGRWDDAVAAMVTASHLPGASGDNVSQVINLAGLYNALARPADAVQALEGLGDAGMSPYGRMQVEYERLDAAMQSGDAPTADAALAYLDTHQADSPETYQRGLVSADHADDAARLLIRRLGDADLRDDALMELQEYLQGPMPPRAAELERRWRTLIARPDVGAAAARAGKIGRVPLRSRAH